MPVLPFPLETVQADSSDWPAGSDRVSGSHSECGDNLRPLTKLPQARGPSLWAKSFMNEQSS